MRVPWSQSLLTSRLTAKVCSNRIDTCFDDFKHDASQGEDSDKMYALISKKLNTFDH